MEAKLGAHCTVSAVVTRADGTVEDLGVICGGEMKPMEKPSLTERIRRVLKNG